MTTILTGTIIDAYEAAKELKENQKNSSDYIASYSCDYIASYSIAKLWMSKRKTKDVASASEYKLKLFLIIYYFIINSKLEKNIRITNIHRCKYYVKLFSYLHII